MNWIICVVLASGTLATYGEKDNGIVLPECKFSWPQLECCTGINRSIPIFNTVCVVFAVNLADVKLTAALNFNKNHAISAEVGVAGTEICYPEPQLPICLRIDEMHINGTRKAIQACTTLKIGLGGIFCVKLPCLTVSITEREITTQSHCEDFIPQLCDRLLPINLPKLCIN